MDALTYFNSLKSQGFDDGAALIHTNQYYPEFKLNSVANTENYDDWFYQNFQQIAAECYPDDEGAIFTIASITNKGEFIEVVAHSNPTIGYDPVRYDFSISNGVPSLRHTFTPEPDGTWNPFFSTGNSVPQPAPVILTPTVQSNSVPQSVPMTVTPIVQSNSFQQTQNQQFQTPQPQQMMGGQQQYQQQYAPQQQQPMMQGQPMQAFSQNHTIMSSPSTNAILALVLAIIGIVTSLFYGLGLFFAIPALILANGSLRITNQFPNHPDAGIAKAAKVCAWVAIGLFIAVIGTVVLAGVLYVWAASLA